MVQFATLRQSPPRFKNFRTKGRTAGVALNEEEGANLEGQVSGPNNPSSKALTNTNGGQCLNKKFDPNFDSKFCLSNHFRVDWGHNPRSESSTPVVQNLKKERPIEAP